MAHFQLAALRRIGKPEVVGRVYIVRNAVDANTYIGSTLLRLNQRMKSHKGMAKCGKSPLHRLMRELGNSCFSIVELEQVILRGTPEEQQRQLSERESHWIMEQRPSLNGMWRLAGTEDEDRFIRERNEMFRRRLYLESSEQRNELWRCLRERNPELWKTRSEAMKARYRRDRVRILQQHREKRERGLYVQNADRRHLELEGTGYKFKSRMLLEQLRWMCRLQEALE